MSNFNRSILNTEELTALLNCYLNCTAVGDPDDYRKEKVAYLALSMNLHGVTDWVCEYARLWRLGDWDHAMMLAESKGGAFEPVDSFPPLSAIDFAEEAVKVRTGLCQHELPDFIVPLICDACVAHLLQDGITPLTAAIADAAEQAAQEALMALPSDFAPVARDLEPADLLHLMGVYEDNQGTGRTIAMHRAANQMGVPCPDWVTRAAIYWMADDIQKFYAIAAANGCAIPDNT